MRSEAEAKRAQDTIETLTAQLAATEVVIPFPTEVVRSIPSPTGALRQFHPLPPVMVTAAIEVGKMFDRSKG